VQYLHLSLTELVVLALVHDTYVREKLPLSGTGATRRGARATCTRSLQNVSSRQWYKEIAVLFQWFVLATFSFGHL
jgi:hypothetical protein